MLSIGDITFTKPSSIVISIPNPPNFPWVSLCISSQISSEERLDHADLVLENNGTDTDLEEKLKEALEDLQTLEE